MGQTTSTTPDNTFASELAALRPTLRLMALRYTHDRSRAEDLVHDTLLRALKYQHTYLPGSHLRAWVATIMTNTFINGYRRRRKEMDILGNHGAKDVAATLRSDAARRDAMGPELSCMRNVLSDTVLLALTHIPEEFREVVVLCDLMDQSYREASAILRCPLGTVMSRLHRGRKLLKIELSDEARAQGILRVA